MKKLILNNQEKSTILEMHKSMGYKTMINETMDISDINTKSELETIISDLNVSYDELEKINSMGEDELIEMIGCIPEEFQNINTVDDVKNLFKTKVKRLNEQDVDLGDDVKYLYAMGGLLLLGIITGIANNAKNIGKFFKRLFRKKPKCARRR